MLLNPAQIAIVVFIITYILLIKRVTRPMYITGGAALLLLLTRTISPDQALSSINFNVLGILWGMMVLAELFIASNAPEYFASLLLARVHTAGWALVVISAFAGLISSFVDNVATVLIVAPIAFNVARRLHTSPTPFIIGIAISSNLQGTATLVGDTTSVVLASMGKMDFLDFFWMQGKPSIFFAVELGAIAATAVLYLLFRHLKQPIDFKQTTLVRTWVPSWLLLCLIIVLATSSLIPNRPEYIVGLITVIFGVIGIIWNQLWGHLPLNLAELDWETFFFLIGIFVLVGSLSATGVVSSLATAIAEQTGGNVLTAFLILVWLSVLVSAFVDNIPYTITMLPVAQQVALSLGCSPYLLMFGLAVGTSLGGNITPIGASANVVAVGLLRKEGVEVSFGEFVKIGLPFTLTAVTVASLFLWIVWA